MNDVKFSHSVIVSQYIYLKSLKLLIIVTTVASQILLSDEVCKNKSKISQQIRVEGT